MGYEYMGVSEHSQSAFYAHGLGIERVLEQREEVRSLNSRLKKFTIFHGIESDILADGSLDYPDEILAEFDFVVASLHGQLRQNREDMTKRLCKALENPYTSWLGHPTARLLLGRKPVEADMEKVIRTAAANNKGLELNANPYRLDLDWRYLALAKELGVKIGIHSDAHSKEGLQDVRYGVWMARKGGLSAADVTNTFSLEAIKQWLKQTRSKKQK
jgi:DNA polymerase (family 10)